MTIFKLWPKDSNVNYPTYIEKFYTNAKAKIFCSQLRDAEVPIIDVSYKLYLEGDDDYQMTKITITYNNKKKISNTTG